MNPYTAVPQALRESRRTLRDIITDMAATRSEEAKSQFAQSQQKGEIELAEMQSKAKLAEIAAGRKFKEDQLDETTRHHKAIENIQSPQAEMLNKTDTLHNWMLSSPLISSAVKDIASKNLPPEELNQVVSGHQAKQMFDQISKTPGFFYRNLKGLAIDKLESITAQIQDPNSGLDQAAIQKLHDEEYKPLFDQLEKLSVILGENEKITPEQEETIIDMAMDYVKAGAGTVSLEDAIVEVMDAVKQIRNEVHGNKKWFPASLEELLSPADEASAAGGDDKGSWKHYLKNPPKSETTPKPRAQEPTNPTLRKIMTDPYAHITP